MNAANTFYATSTHSADGNVLFCAGCPIGDELVVDAQNPLDPSMRVTQDARQYICIYIDGKHVLSACGPYDRREVAERHFADWTGHLGAEYSAAHRAGETIRTRQIWRKIGAI